MDSLKAPQEISLSIFFPPPNKKAPTLFIPQQWRRAHRLENTAGRCHALPRDLTTRARHRLRIAVDATIRDPRRVRLDPDRDRLRRRLVAMDATGARAETGVVIALGVLDRLARALWLRAQRCVLFEAWSHDGFVDLV